MMVGVYGLLFEFMSPGFVLPGVVGGGLPAAGAVRAADAAGQLRRPGADAAGHGFLIAEAFMPSFGALGLGGVVAFAFGARAAVRHRRAGLRRAAAS